MSLVIDGVHDRDVEKLGDDRPPHIRALINRAIRDYAKILPLIIEQRENGKSLIEIARWLNASGYKTRKDCNFNQSTVHKILKRSGYVSDF